MFRCAPASFGRLSMLCLSLWLAPWITAAALDADAQARVRGATVEVVMQKPQADSLSYERALPLHLLPFTERTDKYISIGTAFAIGDNRFVTAAHVLEGGVGSQFGEPALRASDGTVYPIDQVLKYSQPQDFAVISVKGKLPAAPLAVNRDPQINDAVFAAGNALGEGIVIRDGLFTSQTPEQDEGAWKWIRFSAAASPGNSGGPLLDKQGQVIGVVLRKSENENLNYAVPISLVLDAPENVATLKEDGFFYISVMDARESGEQQRSVTLPKPFGALSREIMAFREGFYAGLKADLLRNNADAIFPRGGGSAPLLHNSVTAPSLLLISRKDDGVWDLFQPSNMQNAQLADNGFVAHGELVGFTFMKIRRPDSAPTAQFYADSKQYMDTVLKAISWKRDVGRESVRITSAGKAQQESTFEDVHGRKWQLRLWNVEYSDSVVMSLALPVPDGYVALLQTTQTADVFNILDEMKTVTTFAYTSYTGTLRQWQEFLALRELLPKVFADIKIDAEYDKALKYASRRIDVSVSNELQKIQPDSPLTLNFSFFEDGGNVVWDVAGLTLAQSISGEQAIVFVRHAKPPAGLPQSFGTRWQKLASRDHPFNARVMENAGSTFIDAVYPYPSDTAAAADRVVYEVAFAKQGKQTQEEMQAGLMRLFEGVKVREK